MASFKRRDDLAETKRREIIRQAAAYIEQAAPEFQPQAYEIARSLFQANCIRVTPPQEPELVMYEMTFSSGHVLEGQSRKPGNIRINIKMLIKSLPELTERGVNIALGIPVLKVASALAIWRLLLQTATIKIERPHAVVVLALWQNCDQYHRIGLEKGFERVNLFCRQIGEPELDWETYILRLQELEKNKNLELDDHGIWMCEWVKIPF